jgi:hypothetical protein
MESIRCTNVFTETGSFLDVQQKVMQAMTATKTNGFIIFDFQIK